jgi:hypothetical protein
LLDVPSIRRSHEVLAGTVNLTVGSEGLFVQRCVGLRIHRFAETGWEAFRELQQKGYIRCEDLPVQTKDGKKWEVEIISNVFEETDSMQYSRHHGTQVCRGACKEV